MRKLFSTLFLLGAFVGNANSTTINGAGASFPYPIYAKWAQMYQEATDLYAEFNEWLVETDKDHEVLFM